eukprot:m.19409 g.19409  ORF g.19409 m.19409 type:complete len:1010 (+) comp8026_c0_seq2:368-3397(+)
MASPKAEATPATTLEGFSDGSSLDATCHTPPVSPNRAQIQVFVVNTGDQPLLTSTDNSWDNVTDIEGASWKLADCLVTPSLKGTSTKFQLPRGEITYPHHVPYLVLVCNQDIGIFPDVCKMFEGGEPSPTASTREYLRLVERNRVAAKAWFSNMVEQSNILQAYVKWMVHAYKSYSTTVSMFKIEAQAHFDTLNTTATQLRNKVAALEQAVPQTLQQEFDELRKAVEGTLENVQAKNNDVDCVLAQLSAPTSDEQIESLRDNVKALIETIPVRQRGVYDQICLIKSELEPLKAKPPSNPVSLIQSGLHNVQYVNQLFELHLQLRAAVEEFLGNLNLPKAQELTALRDIIDLTAVTQAESQACAAHLAELEVFHQLFQSITDLQGRNQALVQETQALRDRILEQTIELQQLQHLRQVTTSGVGCESPTTPLSALASGQDNGDRDATVAGDNASASTMMTGMMEAQQPLSSDDGRVQVELEAKVAELNTAIVEQQQKLDELRFRLEAKETEAEELTKKLEAAQQAAEEAAREVSLQETVVVEVDETQAAQLNEALAALALANAEKEELVAQQAAEKGEFLKVEEKLNETLRDLQSASQQLDAERAAHASTQTLLEKVKATVEELKTSAEAQQPAATTLAVVESMQHASATDTSVSVAALELQIKALTSARDALSHQLHSARKDLFASQLECRQLAAQLANSQKPAPTPQPVVAVPEPRPDPEELQRVTAKLQEAQDEVHRLLAERAAYTKQANDLVLKVEQELSGKQQDLDQSKVAMESLRVQFQAARTALEEAQAQVQEHSTSHQELLMLRHQVAALQEDNQKFTKERAEALALAATQEASSGEGGAKFRDLEDKLGEVTARLLQEQETAGTRVAELERELEAVNAQRVQEVSRLAAEVEKAKREGEEHIRNMASALQQQETLLRQRDAQPSVTRNLRTKGPIKPNDLVLIYYTDVHNWTLANDPTFVVHPDTVGALPLRSSESRYSVVQVIMVAGQHRDGYTYFECAAI